MMGIIRHACRSWRGVFLPHPRALCPLSHCRRGCPPRLFPRPPSLRACLRSLVWPPGLEASRSCWRAVAANVARASGWAFSSACLVMVSSLSTRQGANPRRCRTFPMKETPSGGFRSATAVWPPKDGSETVSCSMRVPDGMNGAELEVEVKVERISSPCSRNLVRDRAGNRHRRGDIFGGRQSELKKILERLAGAGRLGAGKRDAVVQIVPRFWTVIVVA